MRDSDWRERISYADPGCEAAVAGRETARDAPMLSLRGSSVAERFRAWTGQSGRRYVFSVFPVREAGALDGLPLDGAVAIGAARSADGTRRVLFVAEVGSAPDAFLAGPAMAALRGCAGAELHLHCLAADAPARRLAAADLGA